MAITDLIPWRRPTSLLSSSDWAPMSSLQREMNRMFDDFMTNGTRLGRTFTAEAATAFYPDLDIVESEKHIDVTAELAGMTEKDTKVTLSDDGEMLTIEGEKTSESESKSETQYCSERRYGHFRRVVSLPTRVDPNHVDASCRNGVLKIHMKKLPEQQQHIKQIPIKAG